jgi:hypothetical protein
VKNGEKRKLFYLGDFAVFLTILILAAVSFFLVSVKPSGGKLTAVVTLNGSELYRIDLEAVAGRTEFEISGSYQELLVAENGRIRFERANCPDQICVKTGWISRPGQVAVCVPAGVIVKITGDGGGEEIDIFLK